MKRHSITRWIILSFTGIFLTTLIISATANYFTSLNEYLEQGARWSVTCAKIVGNLLDRSKLGEMTEEQETEYMNSARETIRYLCQAFDYDYIYVYYPYPENKIRYYYVCVADDDQMDEVVKKQLIGDVPMDTPLLDEEKRIMDGESDLEQIYLRNDYGDEVTWLAPHRKANGDFCAMIGLDYNLNEGKQKLFKSFFEGILPFEASLILGVLLMLFLVQRRIVRPVSAISDSMNSFANNSRKKPEPLHINFKDEIGGIAESYEKMTEEISGYINNIEALTRDKLENNVQLDVARRIQYGLVPERTDLSGPRFSACAITKPAKAVGGDFYDCFKRDKNTVCLVMGDVSGKGVSAAIFMAMAKTMLREKLMVGLSPSGALNQANDELCKQNPEGLFATVFVAVLNLVTGDVRFANAGHNSPVLLKEEPTFLEMESGIPLGVFVDSGIEDESLHLDAGQGIILYTDGVNEAVNPANDFFGNERIISSALAVSKEGGSSEDMVLGIKKAVETFCDGNEPFDDMAVMTLYVLEPEHGEDENIDASGVPWEGWIPIPVELKSFDLVKKSVFGIVGETKEAKEMLLACDEALTNVVNYSGALNVAYLCEMQGDKLCVAFSDNGLPFDPLAYQADQREFDMLDKGGMGLNIIKQTVSSVKYERKDDRNILWLYFTVETGNQ